MIWGLWDKYLFVIGNILEIRKCVKLDRGLVNSNLLVNFLISMLNICLWRNQSIVFCLISLNVFVLLFVSVKFFRFQVVCINNEYFDGFRLFSILSRWFFFLIFGIRKFLGIFLERRLEIFGLGLMEFRNFLYKVIIVRSLKLEVKLLREFDDVFEQEVWFWF